MGTLPRMLTHTGPADPEPRSPDQSASIAIESRPHTNNRNVVKLNLTTQKLSNVTSPGPDILGVVGSPPSCTMSGVVP